MDKRAENTFVAGLNTDRHPLTSQKTELIEAQNIDLIAIGEGYQLILQKREGNLELLMLPPVWSSLYTYITDEYAVEGPSTYKALANPSRNLNQLPSTSPTFWQLQPPQLVSAGLRPGYIPLAVKEFNNIAYIISVDPTAYNLDPNNALTTGEIGTFPSPDYTRFIYELGPLRGGDATIGTPIWDPRIDPPNYAFDITPVGPVIDELVTPFDETSKKTLTLAGFSIHNTGISPDTYTINSNIANPNIKGYVDAFPFTLGAAAISVAAGQTRVVTFEVQIPCVIWWTNTAYFNAGMYASDGVNVYVATNPGVSHPPSSSPTFWNLVGSSSDYPVATVVNTILTISSDAVPANVLTYNYQYHIDSIIAVRREWPINESIYHFGFLPIVHSTYNAAGNGSGGGPVGQVSWRYITNDSTVVVTFNTLVILPTQSPGDSTGILGDQIGVQFNGNPSFIDIRYTSGLEAICTFATVANTFPLYAEQNPHL